MFSKKTIQEYEVEGKRVLLRADFNVPLKDGKVVSDYRITETLPTIQYLQNKNCKIIICSHLGRPKDENDKEFSLKPVAEKLSEILDQEVKFVKSCIGEEVDQASEELKNGQILLLENLRFNPGEKENSDEFAQELIDSTRAEILVQDAFGAVHRKQASLDAVARKIPAISGLLLEKEVDTITHVMDEPKKPFMAIVGGAKIADKIDIIHRFIEIADAVVIGGAMANTFLKALDVGVGDSLVDDEEVEVAKDIIEEARKEAKIRKFIFYLPQDGVVASKIDSRAKLRIVDWDAHIISSIESYPAIPKKSDISVGKNEKILDIGPVSGSFIAGLMQRFETVVWNGTMGVTEVKPINGTIGPFAHGTEYVIDALVGRFGHRPYSLLGGGDTTGYIDQRDINDMFDHVSTGGGASLDLMSGKDLPGVSVLWDK